MRTRNTDGRVRGGGSGLAVSLLAALCACSGGGGADAVPPGGGGGGGSAAAFALSVPASRQLVVGGLADLAVQVVPDAGFDGLVELAVHGVPDDVVGVLGETSVRSGEVLLGLSAGPAAPVGRHVVTVVGRSGTVERSAPFELEIVDAGFDFDVGAVVRAVDLEQGADGRVELAFDVRHGVPPAPDWSVDGLPVGIEGTVVTAGARAELELTAGAAAPVGMHAFVVAATADPLRREVTMVVRVVPAAEDEGLAIGLPPVVQVRRGGATAAQVEVARAAGVTGDVALVVAGLPADTTAVVDDQPVRGAVALLTFRAGASAPLGEHVVRVAGSRDAATGAAHLLLQVVGDEPLADARVQRVELAQSFLAADPGLVGGKPALLRAHVVAERTGVAAPEVRVAASVAGVALGERTLSGPATLPTGEEPADLAQSFRTELPAEWVTQGVELVVAVDPDGSTADRDERNDRVRVVPRVGAENRLDIVIVPLRLAGREAGAFSGHRELLIAHWPLAEAGVSIRAAYTVTSVQDVSSDGTGWSSVLSEIAGLRSADGSSAYYYGVVPVGYGGGVAGMGYIGAPVSIGWHRTLDVMLHELGHNFGLRHAPCGGAGGVDAGYPFANAILGHWGWDARSGGLKDPRTTVDLMSYCGPDWVSGYNHEKVRLRLGGAPLREGGGGGAAVPVLLVRGEVGADGSARLGGVVRAVGVPDAGTAHGDVGLRLTFGGGRTARFGMVAAEIGCGAEPGTRQFAAAVPDPGEVEALELLDGERVLLRVGARRPPVPEGVAASVSALGLVLDERDGALRVRWDAEAWPDLAVTHVDGTSRTALALQLRGGSATLPLDGVPPGGAFEIGVADGIDGFSVRVPR